MSYKPNDKGKKFDRRTALYKYACNNIGRDCPDFKDDGDKVLRECILTCRCNWKGQGYTPIPRWPLTLSSEDEVCFGVIIKEEELN